jgi:hypothetical protein
MWFVFAGIAVFVGGAALYLVLMIYFPEWVGITGETALKAEESHKGEFGGNSEGNSEGKRPQSPTS